MKRRANTMIRDRRGFTLVEMMVTVVALGLILVVLNSVFFSSNDLYSKTNQRASIQMASRRGLSTMTREIRHAGCDPAEIGVIAISRATSDSLRIVGDINGDGVIQTAEPSENVVYSYDSAADILFRDPGTGPDAIVTGVSALTFTYLDAAYNVLPAPLSQADAANVRAISLSITTSSQDAGEITLNTTIALRNM